MFKFKVAVLAVAIAALAGAGIYFLKYGNRAGEGAPGASAPALDLFGNPIGSSGAGAPPAGAPGIGELSKTYTHEDPIFSFRHPESFSVSAFGDEAGETVLVQAAPEMLKSLNSSALGFQIYITPFDEEGPITAERILKDIPDMVIDQPKEIEIAGVRMFAFLSGDPSSRTREVWFVRGPHLYQLTAYPEFDVGLSQIMSTFTFN